MIFSLRHLCWFRHRQRLAGWAIFLCAGLLGATGAAQTITNTAAIRALNSAEAAAARPARLRVVVIDRAYPVARAMVVADDSGGLYVLAASNLFGHFQRGDLLELSGVTDPGQFAPILKTATAKKIGTAPLPAPLPVSYHQMMTGSQDAQWVELSGIVQSYNPAAVPGKSERIILAVDGNPVHVNCVGPQNSDLAVDAEVRVRGICFYQFNQKRQFLNPILSVPPNIPIRVEKPAPAEPFAAPVRSADSLLQFSPGLNSDHRVHVRGVVTHSQKDGVVWIRDDSAGLRLQLQDDVHLQPGDVVDALGFPKYGLASPILEQVIFHRLGATNPPVPIALTSPKNVFDYEDELVSLTAELKDFTPVLEGVVLTLQSGDTEFKAVLKAPAQVARLLNWQRSSRVRVAGICSVTYNDTKPLIGYWYPQSFQLLLRSPADLTVLKAPPWWNTERLTYALAAASLALLATVGVISLLARKRLGEQQQQRAMAEAEFAAILSERNRVAREIHDTLAQGLTATSFQLRLAKRHAAAADPTWTQHLDAAQDLVRGSLAEARNSIWNMRSQVLETHDLPGALENILKQMTDGSECAGEFKVTGSPRRLAPVIENNLLRVGQEAITNAIRHGRARHVRVQLDFGDKQFRLGVQDDGGGFDASHTARSKDGFGLVGMQERAKAMNGEVQVRSTPGSGTEIVLKIPLSGEV